MTLTYQSFLGNARRPRVVGGDWRRAALRGWLLLPVTWLLAQNPIAAATNEIDLSHWSLTLPDVTASVIPPSELTEGFSNAYFYTGSDGAMVFWTPVTGGTTAASDFPRTELREKLNPWDNSINWPAFGNHVLNARCRVTQLPSTKRVVIAQIHAYYGTAPPLVLLVFNDGNIEGLVKPVSTSSDNTTYALGAVALGKDINYQLQMHDGVVSMTVNGMTTTVDVFATDPAWKSQTFYFKAGSYCMDNFGPATEGAKVRFFDLSVRHDRACAIISVTADVAQCCITWTSEPGAEYFVQGLTSMIQPSWLTLSTNLSAFGNLTSYCVPLPSPHRFFRVGMVAP